MEAPGGRHSVFSLYTPHLSVWSYPALWLQIFLKADNSHMCVSISKISLRCKCRCACFLDFSTWISKESETYYVQNRIFKFYLTTHFPHLKKWYHNLPNSPDQESRIYLCLPFLPHPQHPVYQQILSVQLSTYIPLSEMLQLLFKPSPSSSWNYCTNFLPRFFCFHSAKKCIHHIKWPSNRY